MKNTIISLLIMSCFAYNCQAQKTMTLNKQKSQLRWFGSMKLGIGSHHGTVDFSAGKLDIKDDKIIGGDFVLDMNTIANVDGGYSQGLVNHLKNADFFNVLMFGTANITMTKVTYIDNDHINVKADLTIMGVTKPIEFIGLLFYDADMLSANFNIDRTRWGITYKSEGEASLKNKAISNEIKFEVELYF